MSDKREAIRILQEEEIHKILFSTTHEDPARKEEVKKELENATCPLYEKGCNNMLCPMLSKTGIWYPEEDVCRNPRYKDDMVVVNQKRLKKKHPDGYFTRDMLSKKFVIRYGISGIAPDVPPSTDARGQAAVNGLYVKREKHWNEAHPEISRETIERQKTLVIKLANNMRKIRVVIEVLERKK